MKENIVLILIVIIAAVAIFFFANSKEDTDAIKNIEFSKIQSTIKNDDLAIVYFGTFDKDKEQILDRVIKDKNIKVYTSSATVDEINSMLIVNAFTTESEDIYVLFINADPVGLVAGNASYSVFKELVNEAFYGEIPISKIAYVVPDSKTLIKKINSKKYTVTVFSIDDCIHCTKFLPTINKIAADYGVEINYINRESYDSEGYTDIMALDLRIPAKCTLSSSDTTMMAGFPKPMTIITKNGKLVDCIKGNVKEDVVLDMFKEYGIIEGS